MTEKKVRLSEICFYIVLLSFMGTKAVGLSETQWPFGVAIAIGVVFSLIKFFLTPFNLAEWTVNILLLSMGMVVYVRNSHLEVILAALLIIGMKNVPISRAMKVSLLIWGPLFCLTVIRALLGIEPGFMGTQMKIGIDKGVIRYSLGFTHPNVLHITFFIVVLLLLYVTKVRGKKLLWMSLGLIIINCYVFLYSLSYTGFMVVLLEILANLFFSFKKDFSKSVFAFIMVICIVCFGFPIVGQYILPEPVLSSINRLINYRLELAGKAFLEVPPTLLGSAEPLPVSSLDSSYAYSLYYHGIIPFVLFLLGFLSAMFFSYKKGTYQSVIMLLVMAISGITEQYMGNLSFKNISLLLIGETLYRDVIPTIVKRTDLSFEGRYSRFDFELSLSKLVLLEKQIRNYFREISWKKCVLPTVVFVLIGNIAFGIVYHEPNKVFQVVDDRWGDIEYVTYNANEDDWVKSNDILIIGELKDGCRISQLSWIDTGFEKIRGQVSVTLWSVIIGFCVIVFFFGVKRSKKV